MPSLPLPDRHIRNTEQAQGQGTFDSKRRTEKVFYTQINWKLGCWGEGEERGEGWRWGKPGAEQTGPQHGHAPEQGHVVKL